MRPPENLNLWKKAVEFVVEIYRVTEQFPKKRNLDSLRNYDEHQSLSSPTLPKEQHDDQQRNSGSSWLIHKAQQARLSKRGGHRIGHLAPPGVS